MWPLLLRMLSGEGCLLIRANLATTTVFPVAGILVGFAHM